MDLARILCFGKLDMSLHQRILADDISQYSIGQTSSLKISRVLHLALAFKKKEKYMHVHVHIIFCAGRETEAMTPTNATSR